MTATTLTYIVACEHISDLRHEADRRRRASEIAAPRTIGRWLSKMFARRITQPEVTLDSSGLRAAHTAR